MKAKIILNQPLTQDRYGLHFTKGEALCENEFIIKKLQKKGVKVEIIEETTEKNTLEEMTVNELKKMAAEKEIEVPAKAKKDDIIKLLNGIEETEKAEGEDDSEEETTEKKTEETETPEEESDEKTDEKSDEEETQKDE